MADSIEIPSPMGFPVVGHTHLIQPDKLNESLRKIGSEFNGIFRLRFPGDEQVFVSTQALVNEVCDERRFEKTIGAVLSALRPGLGHGLFTAWNYEEPWGIAHRVLTPAFGPLNIREMFGEMHDIATQLTLKWARAGPNAHLNVTDDFTRLTLDTIALCSMGFRFNSFYSADMHPFVQAMTDFLCEAGVSTTRTLPAVFYRAQMQKFQADIDLMRNTAQEVLDARKSGKTTRDNDLLAAMIKGVDPKTGKKISDESIIYNLITFLVAGHETTSGMLSYTFYHLLKNPHTFEKAQQEVDSVCGKEAITLDHIAKLPYINGALREALRLDSTIPAMGVEAKEDTVIGGKYFVKKGQSIICQIAVSNRDPAVYGEDTLEFKPERMMDENFNRIQREFPNSWKPFGNGKRACIGRPFAWQEALLVMAMLLQNFTFYLEPSDYELIHKESLTLKPDGLRMRATLRDNLTPELLQRRIVGSASPEKKSPTKKTDPAVDDTKGVPLTILYGSNTGTCKTLAQQIATDASSHGFRAIKLDSLDSAKDALPTDHPVVIVTASFEGEPPDNAVQFVSWVKSLQEGSKALEKVSYAVFGCGHSEWVTTFHAIPKLVDVKLANAGAHRIAEMGLSDVSLGATFQEFEEWENDQLWPALKTRYGTSEASGQSKQDLNVAVSNPKNSTLQQDVQDGIVLSTKTLTTCTEKNWTKKHMEVQLPKGMKYEAGDYLAVLPVNPKKSVQRAMRVLGLSSGAHLDITSDLPVPLPINTTISASELLASYVELAQSATKRNLRKLIEVATDKETIASLTYLAEDGFSSEINDKKVSVIDLLERFPSIQIPVGTFLTMLPPMNVRQYSISSSPAQSPDIATITYSMLHAPALSGQGLYIGVATSYLASLEEGDSIQVAIRPSHAALSLPSKPEETPLVLIGAGAGIAPFRGFIQERAHMIKVGRKLAPAILFFGCRSLDMDDLYRDELDEWQRIGAVDVRRAFSRVPVGNSESYGCKYVQHRVWHDNDDVAAVWEKGAKVMVCGSKAVGDSVKDVMIRMKREGCLGEAEKDEGKLEQWFHSLRNVRYVADIFD